MAQFCTECGAPVEPKKKFCTNCGAKIEEPAPAPVPIPAQPAPHPAEPPVQTTAKPLGFWANLGYLFVMNIPAVGLIMAFVWSFVKGNANRSKLALAMIVITIIWHALLTTAVILAIGALKDAGLTLTWNLFGLVIKIG